MFKALLAALASFVLALFVLEGFLIVVDRNTALAARLPGVLSPSAPPLARYAGLDFDRRSRRAVIDDLERQGVVAWPAGNPSAMLYPMPWHGDRVVRRSLLAPGGRELLPLGGISNVTTVYCNETGQHLVYQSDEHGFHNPRGIWGRPAVDIGAVGDSFTHGACVPSGLEFMGRLRARRPATLNLGIDANGPLIMFAGLVEYLAPVRPKVVLWFYCEANDLSDLRREGSSPLLMSYLTAGLRQDLRSNQREIDQALALLLGRVRAAQQLTLRQVATLHHVRRVVTAALKPRELPREYSLTEVELFRTVLSAARSTVAMWGGSIYFVYLPDWRRYATPASSNPDRDLVLSIASAAGLTVIDVHPAFERQPDPLALFPFRRAGHYTEAGHRVVAETVWSAIAARFP